MNVVEEILDRRARLNGIVEKEGEGGKKVLLVEMEEEEDRKELLERDFEIRRR